MYREHKLNNLTFQFILFFVIRTESHNKKQKKNITLRKKKRKKIEKTQFVPTDNYFGLFASCRQACTVHKLVLITNE